MCKWRWDEEVPYEEIMALSEKMWKDMQRDLGECPTYSQRFFYVKTWLKNNMETTDEENLSVYSPLCFYTDRLSHMRASFNHDYPCCECCPLKWEKLAHDCDKGKKLTYEWRDKWKSCKATYKNAKYKGDSIFESAPLFEIIELHKDTRDDEEDFKKRRAAYVNYWRRMREPGKIDYEAMYKDWMLFPDWK